MYVHDHKLLNKLTGFQVNVVDEYSVISINIIILFYIVLVSIANIESKYQNLHFMQQYLLDYKRVIGIRRIWHL